MKRDRRAERRWYKQGGVRRDERRAGTDRQSERRLGTTQREEGRRERELMIFIQTVLLGGLQTKALTSPLSHTAVQEMHCR